jgi:hypothetical protein
MRGPIDVNRKSARHLVAALHHAIISSRVMFCIRHDFARPEIPRAMPRRATTR